MIDLFSFLAVTAIGGFAQIVDGSLGMGFGVFSSSLLIATGSAPAVAVAIVNAAKIFTGLASGLAHWRLGNVRADWCIPLSLGGVVGGFLGGYLLTSVSSEQARPWVSGLLLIIGVLIILRNLRGRPACESQSWGRRCESCSQSRWERVSTYVIKGATLKFGALGFVSGLVNGLTGAYGPIATAGVLFFGKGEPRHAIGTVSLAEFVVAGTVATTILGRQGVGGFPVWLAVALALGGTIAAPLAAYICRKMPARGLAYLVGSLLVVQNYQVVTLLVR